MLGFLRHAFSIVVALIVGYLLGNGPFAEWVTDVGHQLGVAWAIERASRGPGGTLPLLAAGFLLGQGLFLMARTLAKRIGPWRARHTERVASWDPSLKLGTRFGLFQYLEQCNRWAAEDPTTRTQTLALFKIYGLGALNESKGSLATTGVLQDIAAELRSASLPDSASAFTRFRTNHLPRPIQSIGPTPAARYPSRWSGATFALAFRELDAVQAVAIARDIANWISRELEAVAPEGIPLKLAAAIAVGSPGATGRALSRAAASALSPEQYAKLKVLCDPADVRAPVISQMSDVLHQQVTFDHAPDMTTPAKSESSGVKPWLRAWGPPAGCLLGAIVLLRVTSGNSGAPATLFPWPESLKDVQIVDASGPRTIHLVRTLLGEQNSGGWRLSDALLIQGDVKDGPYPLCQMHVTITNQSPHTYYVSALDFHAVDEKGRLLEIDPARVVRMAQGLTGRWLAPGQSLSGWLAAIRRDAAVIGLRFEPDRSTRMLLTKDSQVAVISE